jgi:hypothetical protein
LDSANYRGLALNLAAGKGYVFGDWAPKQIYPGFPYLLAGIERLLGPSDRTPSLAEQQRLIGPSAATTASVVFVLVCAGITCVLTYKLIRLHYAPWIATTITYGVASNAVFLQHAHGILTDVPFLMAVMLSLYGWELLKRAQTARPRISAAGLAVGGLLMAAMLRPTFWIVAVCWAAVCAWGLIRGPRKFYAICLLTLLAIGAGTFVLRPVGYEREAIHLLPDAPAHFGDQLYDILRNQLPAAVFGEQLAPFSVLGSLLVLGSTLLLLRRHALWVLMVLCTFAVTMLLSAEPRYYTMVLPALLLGWLSLFVSLARRLPRFWGEVVLGAGLAIVAGNNFTASVGFIVEQRRSDFLAHYKKGGYVPVLDMAQAIRQHVGPGQKVLGPSGSIMSVFSGVHVYTQREALPNGEGPRTPEALARQKFDFAVFPAALYRAKEPLMARLMTKRIITPIKRVAGSEKMYLASVKVTVPETDWRRLPRAWKPPPDIVVKKPVKRKKPATTQAVRSRPATRPTTRPVTRPAARPATRPASKPATTRSVALHHDLRATTTMLSPEHVAASGPPWSTVCVNGRSLLTFDTAAAICGPAPPAFLVVSFLIPK